ncbi:hypothetical protein D0A37_10710 [Microcoleus vaginatus HSN003]|nr:hypothetical protein D0A37_10710 [Microcoleus vaginatus HSN003]
MACCELFSRNNRSFNPPLVGMAIEASDVPSARQAGQYFNPPLVGMVVETNREMLLAMIRHKFFQPTPSRDGR